MMNLEDMTQLITAYDGVREVEKAANMLTSSLGNMAYGRDECAIGKLSCLWDVIMRNSMMYKIRNKEEDFDMRFQVLFSIVCDDSVTAEERAKIILTLE